jgi:two-component system, NtrC family, sensor kinase
VACSWRIRHKLILGMSLVAAVMALLLGGTLHGLETFRACMGVYESKLEELDLAVQVKEQVRKLQLPITDKSSENGTIRERMEPVEKALVAFKTKLEETIKRGRAPNEGKQEMEYVQALEKDMLELDLALKDDETTVRTSRPGLLDRGSNVFKKMVKAEEHVSDLIGTITGALGSRVGSTRNEARKSIILLITTGIMAILLMAGLLRFFYRWVAQPIRDLAEGVSKVAHGDFQHRIEIHSDDEIEDLAKSYNDMTDKLRAMYENLAQQVNDRSRQLVRSERLAGVGFLAAGVAHEINNPLAAILFSSEALESRLAELLLKLPMASQDRETIAKYLKMIQEEAFRCKNITERLLDFSRCNDIKRERIDLTSLIEGVVEMIRHIGKYTGKSIVFLPRAPVMAHVDAQEIKQVVLNLIVNALDAMDAHGTLKIDARYNDGMAEVVFADTGCGMSPEVLENIFEPFFTKRRDGKGTGLGLSITHRIVSQHDGEIMAESDGEGRGSTFTVRLPIHPTEIADDGPAPLRGPGRRRTEPTTSATV